jgi:iron complex transport system substrate-binding protein
MMRRPHKRWLSTGARQGTTARRWQGVVWPCLVGVSCALVWCTATWAQTTSIDADQHTVVIKERARLVTVGGALTEIVYALGAGARLVGVDTSSTYPEAATTLPRVGYQRLLSAEGVLSLNPSLILVSAEAGPPAAISQLRAAGAAVLKVPVAYTVDGVQAKIRLVAQALGLEPRGEELIELLGQEMAEAGAMLRRIRSQPRVLFIYARSSGALHVSGLGTAADAMIRLAGGENAVTGYDGYRPLTAEAVVAAAPAVLLLPTRSLEILGGLDSLLMAPGLALTPAGEKRRIVAMDDLYLLGFGPRTGQAVRELAARLHPELSGDAR